MSGITHRDKDYYAMDLYNISIPPQDGFARIRTVGERRTFLEANYFLSDDAEILLEIDHKKCHVFGHTSGDCEFNLNAENKD